jgi:RNA polymerase sigma-70 factor (ECF subfamily)
MHAQQSMHTRDYDADSVEGVRQDRMAEFVELYSGHYPRLQYYVMALAPTANDAAEILQETSLVLWKRFGCFEPGTNFFAWACKIARLQALKFRERQARSAQLFELSVLEQLADEALQDDSDFSLRLQALDGCIKKLSDSDRTLIRKRYQPGVSVKDIARDAGRTANSLSQSLGRIRRALMACIEHVVSLEGRR